MTSSLMRRSFHYLGRSSGRPFVYRPPHSAQSGLDRCVVRLLLRWHQRSPTVGASHEAGQKGSQQAQQLLAHFAHGGGGRTFGSQRHQRRTGQGARPRPALGVHAQPIRRTWVRGTFLKFEHWWAAGSFQPPLAGHLFNQRPPGRFFFGPMLFRTRRLTAYPGAS